MDNPKIMPFGKYKGQPIEVLQGDPDYRAWLISQRWFQTNHAELYAGVIMNEPTETPEVAWLADGSQTRSYEIPE
jgi:hypothetical protein